MMFADFPKVRAPLPAAYQRIYASHYKENRSGGSPASSLAQRMERWLHSCVAEDLCVKPGRQLATLELGAGTLNQLQHEPDVGPYDIVEPFESLYSDSPVLPRVRHVYADIDQVPSDARYDRITSVATFEHICNLPEVVARSARLLAPGGSLRASIPSEGTPLWTLGWMLTTGLEFRIRHGLDYGVLMRNEHVNTASEIEQVLRHFFRRVDRKVLGASRALSLYQFFACADPDLERVDAYVEQIGASS